MSDESLYLNRELSWLEFNQRVLDEAADPSVPLLERLKFLAITASNLDEFFMVRVGGMRLLIDEGSTKPEPSGLTPSVNWRRCTSASTRCAPARSGSISKIWSQPWLRAWSAGPVWRPWTASNGSICRACSTRRLV